MSPYAKHAAHRYNFYFVVREYGRKFSGYEVQSLDSGKRPNSGDFTNVAGTVLR